MSCAHLLCPRTCPILQRHRSSPRRKLNSKGFGRVLICPSVEPQVMCVLYCTPSWILSGNLMSAAPPAASGFFPQQRMRYGVRDKFSARTLRQPPRVRNHSVPDVLPFVLPLVLPALFPRCAPACAPACAPGVRGIVTPVAAVPVVLSSCPRCAPVCSRVLPCAPLGGASASACANPKCHRGAPCLCPR